jgi:hypothetical protein
MKGEATLTWTGYVNEDGTYSILARVCSLSGSGDEVEPGEGNVVTQADVTSITAKVYSLGASKTSDGTEITPAPTVTVGTSIFDTLRTTGWKEDTHGYNFRHDLGVSYVPAPREWYVIEYRFTFVGGGIAWLPVYVKTSPIRTS